MASHQAHTPSHKQCCAEAWLKAQVPTPIVDEGLLSQGRNRQHEADAVAVCQHAAAAPANPLPVAIRAVAGQVLKTTNRQRKGTGDGWVQPSILRMRLRAVVQWQQQ